MSFAPVVSLAVFASACAAPAATAATAALDLDVDGRGSHAIVAAAKTPETHGPLLWRVENARGTRGYILGTIHLGVDASELDPVVWEALAGSTVFAMEADLGSELGPGPGGDSASLSLREFRWLEELAGRPAQALAALPAWQLYSVILHLQYPTSRPLDLALLDRAAQSGADLTYLEEAGDQLVWMAESVTGEDVRALLDPVGTARAELARLVEDYRRGDIAAIERAAAGPALEREVLLDRRNLAWMDRLVPLLERGEVFVAVGAAHLPGPGGVLALLERSGFRTRRVLR